MSSHHMEYVKFLSQTVDDTASMTSSSVSSGVLGHPRAVRGQAVDRRRGSIRGGACLSAKAQNKSRRLPPPYFHGSQPKDDQQQTTQAVQAEVITASNIIPVTTESKSAVDSVSSSAEHTSCSTSTTLSASAGRKTTPIVYFDDDESVDTPATTTPTSASQPGTKRQPTQGSSSVRKQPNKPRKAVRAGPTTDHGESSLEPAGHNKQGGTKRRKRITDVKNDQYVNVEAGDDDLTDFEDAQPSASSQVRFLHLIPGRMCCECFTG